jgi:hypothetical protein
MFFLSLEPAHSLLMLLLLARDRDAQNLLLAVMGSLPCWGAFALGLWFERYDVIRDGAAAPVQRLLPEDSECYFGEVFGACGDAEDIKQGMLKKGQQFVRETCGGLLESMMMINSDSDGGDDSEAQKRVRTFAAE